MLLTRIQPAIAPNPLHGEFDRLFDGFFSGSRSGYGVARNWVPPMDVAENQAEFVLTADLPGVDESDIEIEVKDGVLAISGERRDQRDSEEAGFRRVERSFGRFSRAMRLPEDTDPEKVTASFDRGVLEVRIAKPEERKPHKVAISAGAPAAEEAKVIEAESESTEK